MDFMIVIQEKMKNAKLLKEIKDITAELEECAGGAGSNLRNWWNDYKVNSS